MGNFQWHRFRHLCYNILHNTEDDSKTNRCINYMLIGLIICNVAAVLLESVNSIYHSYRIYFDTFEEISIAIFSIEYLLRLWSIVESKPDQPVWKTRFKWMISGAAIIDLMAILPGYLNFFVHFDLRFLRILRLVRLLKLTRYFVSLQILLAVIGKEKGSFQAVIFILMIMIVMAASGVYIAENQAQPDAFGSIPQAMWWAVVTLTTVGYGDVTPITPVGKLLGAMITILGVGLAALPAGILATGLANELNSRQQNLEQEFRELLIEGEVDLIKDQEKIEKIRRKVGLKKEQIHEILMQLVREQSIEQKEQDKKPYHYCPHCGEKLKHIKEKEE